MIRTTDRCLKSFFAQVYKPLKLRGRSTDTTRLYANTLRNFARYLGHEGTLDDLEDDVVSGFLGWHTEKENSPETANKEGGQILALWRFAARKRYVEEWPDVDLLPCPKRVPRAWLEPELERLFAAAEKEPGTICGIRAAIWWKCLLCIVYFTAERIGAVRRLEWQDVDIDTGWVLMRAEGRKGKRSDKSFPLPDDAIELLRLIRRKDGLVFPWPYCFMYIYPKYKRILERAELPTDRKSKFHRIRKTTASYYKAAGGDPSELLDHVDPRTTKKYLDPRICGDKLSAKVLKVPWKK